MKYSNFFTKITLVNGKQRVILTEGAPAGLGELIHHIHKEFFNDCWPNDWIYKTIRMAFLDIEDGRGECPIEADIYTSDLLEWLYENGQQYAIDLVGVAEFGIGIGQNLMGMISNGQLYAMQLIYKAVNKFLQDEDAKDGREESSVTL